MSSVISRFCEFYRQLDTSSVAGIEQIYADDITFEDPVHRIDGLENMIGYFEGMLSRLNHCEFAIERIVEQDGEAFVQWLMHFSHPRLRSGDSISVAGVSYLRFDDRIHYHRDYFDLGQMLYQQLPVLGAVIRKVKSRLAA